MEPSPFDIILKDEDGLEQFSELTHGSIKQLLLLIDSLRKSQNHHETCVNNEELFQKNINLSAQIHELQGELSVLNDTKNALTQEISNLTNLNEDLRSLNERLNVRLSNSKTDGNCKCPCKCGARNQNINGEEVKDVVEVTEELKQIIKERDMFKKGFEDDFLSKFKTGYEDLTSEERLLQSKVFKNILYQARALKKRLDRYRDTNDDLYKYKEDYDDKISRETYKIRKREEEKREDLLKQIHELNKKINSIESEKNGLASKLENLQSASKDTANQAHYLNLIETLEKECTARKSSNEELRRLNNELSYRLESANKKITDSLETLKNIEGEDRKAKEIHMLKAQIDELKKEIKIEQSTNENLIKELDVTGTAYEESLKKNKTLAQQINEQEQNYIQLMNERVKESGWKALHDKEKQAYEIKIQSLEELINQLNSVVKEKENQYNELKTMIDSLESAMRKSEHKLREFQEKHEESIKRYQEIEELNKELKQNLDKGSKHCEKIAKDIFELKIKLQKSEEKYIEQEEMHKKEINTDNLRSTDEILNTDLARYRKMIRCSQCSERIREVVITKCFHTFCKKCIDDNLALRKRKCPSCLTKFGDMDVKKIWWN